MPDAIDVDEMRQTLARVSVYRKVCENVRASSGHTLFNGFFFLGIAYLSFMFRGNQFHYTLLGPLIIGTCEIILGLWKRINPSPECVLMDALLQAGFVLSIAIREFIMIQQGLIQKPNTFSILIGLWIAYDAYNTFNFYLQLRRVFVERPTSDHIAYVEDLTAEIESSNPMNDRDAIEIPTNPPLKAKLMGDIALFLELGSRELFICSRNEFELKPVDGGTSNMVRLIILREDYPPCPIDPDSWNNYSNWKS